MEERLVRLVDPTAFEIPEPPDPTMTRSVRLLGVLRPVRIAPDGTLRDGRRRIRAAQALGLRAVPALEDPTDPPPSAPPGRPDPWSWAEALAPYAAAGFPRPAEIPGCVWDLARLIPSLRQALPPLERAADLAALPDPLQWALARARPETPAAWESALQALAAFPASLEPEAAFLLPPLLRSGLAAPLPQAAQEVLAAWAGGEGPGRWWLAAPEALRRQLPSFLSPDGRFPGTERLIRALRAVRGGSPESWAAWAEGEGGAPFLLFAHALEGLLRHLSDPTRAVWRPVAARMLEEALREDLAFGGSRCIA